MKTSIVLAAVGAALVMVSGVANAGTPGSSNNGQTNKLTGKNGAASYADGFFGNVTCNETSHPKFDTVACTMTNTALAGTSGTVEWISDFDHATYGTLTYTVSADGLSYTAQATYPS